VAVKNRAVGLLCVALVPLLGLMVARGGAAEAANLRIEQVTVISPERAQPLRDATVLVRDDRIVSVGAADAKPAAAGETVIDGKGLYLTPGLIDSHVHLSEVPGMTPAQEQAHPQIAQAARAQFPRSFLLYGYTTLVDLISTPRRVAQWNANDVHPDTVFCGATPVIGGYGIPDYLKGDELWREYPYMLVQPGEESKAPKGIDPATRTPRAVVARMKADGAVCLKAFAEDGFGPPKYLPMVRLEVAKELVRAAHEAGLPVFMHANAADMQTFALEAGADVIAHGMWHWDVPPTAKSPPAPLGNVTPAVKTILDEIIARKIGCQPTIQVLHGLIDPFDPAYLADPALRRVAPANLIAWYRTPAPEGQWFHEIIASDFAKSPDGSTRSAAQMRATAQAVFDPLLAQVTSATAYLVQHHGNILFGTDTPSAPTYANQPGLNGFIEMHRLVAAGMTPAQVLRAATLSNAEALRMTKNLGTVQAGKRANLLLMREDPMQSVDAYASIVKVIVGGRVLDASELAANGAEKR
jgi:imidazolonepropionase-like amidohydrolase